IDSHPEDLRLRRDLAATLGAIAEVQTQAGRRHAAEGARRQALEVRDALVRDHPGDLRYRTELAEGYEVLADAQQRVGRLPADALQSRLRAVALREALVRDNPDDPRRVRDLAAGYTDLQWRYHDLGRWADAADAAQRAVDLGERLDRAGHLGGL